MDPIRADAGGEDDNQAEAEQCDEGQPLRERQFRPVECRQRQYPHNEVANSRGNSLGEQRRGFRNAVAVVPGEIPVARDGAVRQRTATVSKDDQGKTAPNQRNRNRLACTG